MVKLLCINKHLSAIVFILSIPSIPVLAVRHGTKPFLIISAFGPGLAAPPNINRIIHCGDTFGVMQWCVNGRRSAFKVYDLGKLDEIDQN